MLASSAILFVRFQLATGLPPQLEGLLWSVTPTYFEIPLKDEHTSKSANIQSSFINVFLKITSNIVVAALSPHISCATAWLLKYLKESDGQVSELPDLIFADGIEPEVYFSGVDFGGFLYC